MINTKVLSAALKKLLDAENILILYIVDYSSMYVYGRLNM